LSCRLEREFRCTELAESMTHNVMSLAIKYASRSKRLTLAQRLSELALEKAAELASAQEGEGEEDQRGGLNAGYSRGAAEWGESRDRRAEEEEDVEKNGEEEEGEEPEEEEEAAPIPPRLGRAAMNSFSKNVASPEQPTTKSGAIVSSNQGRVNPFKVSASQKSPALAGNSSRILDNMSKLSRKPPAAAANLASGKQDSVVIKPLAPRTKSKQGQATLFQSVQSKSSAKSSPASEKPAKMASSRAQRPTTKRPRTGFQLWLDENRQNILSENPELEESDVIKEGMSRFRSLTNEDRMIWTEKAKGDDAGDSKKRKRAEQEKRDSAEDPREESQDSGATKKRKPFDQSANQKLSAFAFNKD
ncbi:WD repeat and HMG-box DNA-binding protein 1-like, partial [Mantella aurantiaca]